MPLVRRTVPDDLRVFSSLPAKLFTVGEQHEQMAVHVYGRLGAGRVPVVCVPGWQRNMSDFVDFAQNFHRAFGDNWPVVLVDLKGRGRSADRGNKTQYVSPQDAADLTQIIAALALEGGIFLGQGYGGQVIMALAVDRPALVNAAILIDSGPVSDPRGLVRLRSNLGDLDGNRSEAGYRAMFRRMLAADYPGVAEELLEHLIGRTHYLDKRGKVHALFDPHLVKMLAAFEHDDILVPQWPYYEALGNAPLLLMRTQLTDQLRRETFEEMMRRRPDADGYVIEGQGSPALLNTPEDVEPIADFVRKLTRRKTGRAA